MRPSPSKSVSKHCSIGASRSGGHLVVLALLGDDLLQLGVEVERLEAVEAALEVCADR